MRPQENRFVQPTMARAIEAAAEALFDPRVAADFVSYRFQSEYQLSTFPEQRDWAFVLSWGAQSARFLRFLAACIERGRLAFERGQPQVVGADVDADREARRLSGRRLQRLHLLLRDDAEHAAWITVVYFSLGRLIGQEATRAFTSPSWNERDAAWLDLDKAFTNAADTELERLLLDGPIPEAEFVERVGDGAPAALGFITALKPRGLLLSGL